MYITYISGLSLVNAFLTSSHVGGDMYSTYEYTTVSVCVFDSQLSVPCPPQMA